MDIRLKKNVLGLLVAILISCPPVSQVMAQSSLESSMTRGKLIYRNECMICHAGNGEGLVRAFPPLANSDYFEDDISKAVEAISNGLEGEIVVNNETYYGLMDPIKLSNQELADVLNYIRNSWGGKATELTANDIEKMR